MTADNGGPRTTTRATVRLKRHNTGRGHWYTIDGQYALGVTTALSEGIPKPALVGWASKTCAQYVADNRAWLAAAPSPEEIIDAVKGAPNRDRDQAANKGTTVHRYAEHLAGTGEAHLEPGDEHLLPHVQAYAQFLDAADIHVVALETPMANTRHRYAGTGDLFARSQPLAELLHKPADSIGYVDLKTNRSGIYMESGLQALAYCRCDIWQPDGPKSEQPMPDIDWAVIVHVTPTGCTVHPVDIDSERHWSLYRAALLVAQARRQKDGWADYVLLPELDLTTTDTAAAAA